MQLTRKKAMKAIDALNDVWSECFRGRTQPPYPYAEWERQREKVKDRLEKLPEYVRRAAELVHIVKDPRGRRKTLSLEKRIHLFLVTRMLDKSNRDMESLLILLEPLFGFRMSYKYIERLYADEEVQLAMHNLFILLVRDEGTSGHFAGDGTGYALAIEHIYRKDPTKKGRKYVYVFRMLDLDTNMYVGYGYSNVSEMDAFHKARKVMAEIGVETESIRLDKYYSSRKVIRLFEHDITLYLIPKNNISSFGTQWPPIFQRIMDDPVAFLKGYFMRNLTETANACDKRRFGHTVRQQIEERQEAALRAIEVLHNIWAVRVKPPAASA